MTKILSYTIIVFLLQIVINGYSVCSPDKAVCVSAYANDSYAIFSLNSTAQGWVAFGPNSIADMSGADVSLFWLFGSQVVLSDRYNTGSDTIPDSQQDIELLSGSGKDSSSNRFIVNFRKKLNTNSGSQDRVILVEQNQQWIFAWNSRSSGNPDTTNSLTRNVQKHDKTWIPTPFKLVSNNSNSSLSGVDPSTAGLSDTDKLFAAHGFLMTICWTILTSIAIFFAAFMKHIGHLWYIIHRGSMIFAAILMIIGFALAVQGTVADHFSSAHSAIGLGVTVVALLIQFPLGYYINKVWNPDRQTIPIHDKVHWWLGRILFVLANVNIILGFQEINDYFALDYSYQIAWYVIISIIIAIFIYQTVMKQSQNYKFSKSNRSDNEQMTSVNVK